MFSLSTTWNTAQNLSGTAIIQQIKNLGFEEIELGFALSNGFFAEILNLQKNGLIKISSVHNFCPVPEGYESSRFTPDFFSLASIDEEQRNQAVALTLNTIKNAEKISARAVVLHCGRVEMQTHLRELIELYNQGLKESRQFSDIIDKMREERGAKKMPHLKALKNSLETIIEKSKKSALNICLENRFYFREIPSPEEFGEIFAHFSGEKKLRYWHDTGHAQVGENLGLYQQEQYLKKYSDKLFGIHLHDVIGTKDHLPPGEGKFDFKQIKPYLKKDSLKVLEVHHPATGEQIKKSVSYLEKIFS